MFCRKALYQWIASSRWWGQRGIAFLIYPFDDQSECLQLQSTISIYDRAGEAVNLRQLAHLAGACSCHLHACQWLNSDFAFERCLTKMHYLQPLFGNKCTSCAVSTMMASLPAHACMHACARGSRTAKILPVCDLEQTDGRQLTRESTEWTHMSDLTKLHRKDRVRNQTVCISQQDKITGKPHCFAGKLLGTHSA